MEQPTTVRQAIKKGNLMLTLPGMTLLFGSMTAFIVLAVKDIIPGIWALFGFPISFILTILFGCFRMVKWRIWAFSRVPIAEWEELRSQAIDSGLIFKKGSFLEKIEIRFPKDRLIVQELENNEVNIEPVEFQDDPSVSIESEFIFSKGVLYVSLARNFLIIAAGIYVVTINPTAIVTYILPAIGILLSINPIIKIRKQTVPKLTLNIEGIGVDDQFYNWQHISEETAKMSGVGKNRSSYIFFNFRGEDRSIDLSSYEVTLPELRHLLKVHRHRNKAVNML